MSSSVKKSMRPRLARLLPSVVILGAGLLVLNASGIFHDAWALGDNISHTDAMAPPPSQKDLAAEARPAASAAEVDVLTSLSKRRAELDQRQGQLDMQANLLAATETRVDGKITQLKAMEAKITSLLAQRDAAQEKQVAALVKTYSAMKPKDAARIFEALNADVLLAVAQSMKSDVLAPVLAAMPPAEAQKLTLRLADRLALPEMASPQAPTPQAALPETTPVAAAAPNPKAGG